MMTGVTDLKVAIVHEWFDSYAGSERVVEQLLNVYPEADVFALVDFLDESTRGFLKGKDVRTSFIQKLPFARKKFRSYLPLMPLAVEQFDLSRYDVVISSSHAVAKGVITHPDQLHICYCHSPIRYAWDMQAQYLSDSGLNRGVKSFIARAILHYLRLWDVRTANGVDYFVANSSYVARRIWRVYRRHATVIHPPVDVHKFPLMEKKDDFYVTASRLVPYKKVSLVVEAFNRMPDKKLVVIGAGPELSEIERVAGPNIEVLGYQSDSVLRDYISRSKAFVYAAIEDFGILPAEAQSCGTPLIALGSGGLLDILRTGRDPTGIAFNEQSSEAIVEAVEEYERRQLEFKPATCRENSMRFSPEQFRTAIGSFVASKWENSVLQSLKGEMGIGKRAGES